LGVQPEFAPMQVFATATGPAAVAIGDLDHNGKPDVVVATAGTNTKVSVLLGNGDGTLQAKTDYALSGAATSVLVTNLDWDGKLDVVVGGVGFVSLFSGNGSGALGARTDLVRATGVTSSPYVAVGDFDRNGLMDVLSSTNTGIEFFKQTSAGVWANGVNSSTTNGGPLGVGDLDRNGKLDVANVKGTATSVAIDLGDGTGAFTAGTAITLPAGAVGAAIYVGDLNRDGIVDVLVADSANAQILYYSGKGDGTFNAVLKMATILTPTSLAVGDLNLDGWPDIVVGTTTSGCILPSAGKDTWNNPICTLPMSTGVAVADMNGDGKPDIITAPVTSGGSSDNVGVMLNLCP
jgi:FG-GAP-like repeat